MKHNIGMIRGASYKNKKLQWLAKHLLNLGKYFYFTLNNIYINCITLLQELHQQRFKIQGIVSFVYSIIKIQTI